MSLYLQCPNSSCLKQTRRWRSHVQFVRRFSGRESTILSNDLCATDEAFAFEFPAISVSDLLRRPGATSSSSSSSSLEEKRTLESCSLRQSGSSVVKAAAEVLVAELLPPFSVRLIPFSSPDSELSLKVIVSASFLRFRLLEKVTR